jgi:hypothetical protein
MGLFEQTAAEIKRLEQITKTVDRGLVWRGLAAKIDAGEIAHRA